MQTAITIGVDLVRNLSDKKTLLQHVYPCKQMGNTHGGYYS
jgi:hypothetical protein